MNTKPLFLFLVFALPVYSQSNQPLKDSANSNKCCSVKHRISFGGAVGCGIPTEGYGLTSANSNTTYLIGYADPGINFNLNVNFRITKHFGLMAEGGGAINTLDKKFYNPNDPDLSNGGTGGTYYITTFMAGPFYSLQFKNGNEFETRLLLGRMLLDKTDIILVGNDREPAMIGIIEGFRSTGICAELGAKFKFHITNHFYITTNIAFTQSLTNALYVYIVPWGPPIIPQAPLGILNTGIGVEFKL